MQRIRPFFYLVLIYIDGIRANVDPEQPLITPAPNITLASLQERSVAGICGYLNADPNSPISCEGTSTCRFAADGGHWGCCGDLSCFTPGTCAPDGRPYCGGVASANCIYPQILQCTNAASPSCVTYYLQTASTNTDSATSWGCGPTPTIYNAFAFTTSGAEISTPTSSDSGTNPTSSSSTPSTTGGGSSGGGGGGGGLGTADIIAIVIPTVAIIAAGIFAWMKREEALYYITCCTVDHRGHRRN